MQNDEANSFRECLLRKTLALHEQCGPIEISFETDEHGKLYLSPTRGSKLLFEYYHNYEAKPVLLKTLNDIISFSHKPFGTLQVVSLIG